MYLNRVILIAFAGKDAEQKFTPNGNMYTRLSVATQRSWKGPEDAEWQKRTEWHNVVAWGNLAEYAAKIETGAHVLIEGEIRYRDYEKDGVAHRIAEIHAESIRPLDRPNRRSDEPVAGGGRDQDAA